MERRTVLAAAIALVLAAAGAAAAGHAFAERKSWLQPDEPIGNPYAPSMLRCGEVVAR
jgi:hypothetical protein